MHILSSGKPVQMKFTARPIIDEMLEFYATPIGPDRFKKYLFKLQGGNKDQLRLPIMGYNPMAKNHVVEKLVELKKLNIDSILEETCQQVNNEFANTGDEITEVVINLADDLKGAWTDRYTTDFENTFNINALAKRNFCTPYFWSGEIFLESLIRERILEAIFRTAFVKTKDAPNTLGECVEQENFVRANIGKLSERNIPAINSDSSFFQKNINSTDYNVIFNFFYGDEASAALNYPVFGNEGFLEFKK